MIVVDTSTWINHIRGLVTPLEGLLGKGDIALHTFVFGELLLNGLPKSGPFAASAFAQYAVAPVASPPEVAAFIGWSKLAAQGVGFVDVHLLISAKYLPDGALLTSDNNLRAQADRLGLAYNP